jgi:ubiquinone/menaquinone biosynthesis C-methylase UbiE
MFRLTFDDHGSGHDDLLLTLGDHRLQADSYYLALDENIQPDSEGAEKVREVLRTLLHQWREAVSDCPVGGTVYLPFDFSDQYTRWLRCQVETDTCVLQPGLSSIEGWNFLPTGWSELQSNLPDFKPIDNIEPLTAAKDRVLAAIDASISGLTDMSPPPDDPSPLFELFRGSYATELLTAAVCHFDVFRRLKDKWQTREQLTKALKISDRASHVLVTALRAMGLVNVDSDQRLSPSLLALTHLIPGSTYDITGYIGLAADSPGVREMTARLRSGRPVGSDEPEKGTAFVMREGTASAMDRDDEARRLTLSLAGRARNVAPALADRMDLSAATTLLDIAGGSGLYSIALLRRYPTFRAIVFDRGPVLKVAEEFAQKYGVADRLVCIAGDMFQVAWPDCDAILLSNVLHDWDVPECRQLLERSAATLKKDGRLFIHDVLLNDALDGPLPIALYSAALFTLTEGRAYSRAEYESWLKPAGFSLVSWRPTLVHCHVLEAVRR